MASLLGFFFTVLIAATLSINPQVADASSEFKVGDNQGWREPGANDTQIYNLWAAHNRFQVGDSLNFEYKEDSVLMVDKWGYYHCNTSKPISAFNDGKTVIKLDTPGPFYFISGAPNHCNNGQRMVINVLALHPPTPQSPPPSIANPPLTYMAESPSPPPNQSSAVSIFTVTLIPIVLNLAITLVSMACVHP
ncbi:stellacyanin-like [Macadamia integrifolia]|uniref:stellacyanin-like n=1 Tax=Macadamia integrifolia TaxID=60698 RepID=UPI001C4FFD71|nr:stellacyanin-like [Macadamia integrifolia]